MLDWTLEGVPNQNGIWGFLGRALPFLDRYYKRGGRLLEDPHVHHLFN